MLDEIERRVRKAASGLLGNESLADNLETEAASSLMKWGLELSKRIVMEFGDIEESLAEEASYPRLRALRMLMRLVNRWGREETAMDRAAKSNLLDQMLIQAGIIYGPRFVHPDEARREAFLDTRPGNPVEFITALRELFEGKNEPNQSL
jgi:hypothetical protein